MHVSAILVDALAVIAVGGLLAIGFYQAAFRALKTEREADRAKADRMVEENKRLEAENKALEAQRDLSKVMKSLAAIATALTEQHELHRETVETLRRMNGSIATALDRNTAAIEVFGRNMPWEQLITDAPPPRRRKRPAA